MKIIPATCPLCGQPITTGRQREDAQLYSVDAPFYPAGICKNCATLPTCQGSNIEDCKHRGVSPQWKDKPKIVCLCGSGRFKEAFDKAEFDNTLAGSIVLTIGCNTHDIARCKDLEHYKPMLDELHRRKIDLADEVLILNVDGYIGESTRSEIEYAQAHGKPIRYLEATLPEEE